MNMWKIRPIVCGEVLAEGSEILAHQQAGVKRWVPSIVWYLTDGTSHLLVDTGFSLPKGDNDACTAGYAVRAAHTMSEALRLAGCPYERVEAIIYTHLHWDHAQNVELFPHARLYVQRDEVRYAVAPLDFEAEAYASLSCGGKPGWLNRQLRFLDGEKELLMGVDVLPTPGHTPGHQSVVVRTQAGLYGIAGDLLPSFDNIKHPESGIFYPPACSDYWAWWTSVNLLASRCDKILPSHEPDLLTDWIPTETAAGMAGDGGCVE